MLSLLHLLLALTGFSLHISEAFKHPNLKMSSIDSGSLQFAIELHKALSSNDRNLVVSPFSLTSALAMTLYGARSDSGSELSKVLFGEIINVEQYQSMVQQFQSLIDKSVNSNSKVLSSANFIYSHVQYPILPDFSQTIEKYFFAKSKQLDFIDGNKGAIDTINEDISKATNGKISNLFENIDPNTKMILANAVYFKGLWESQFKKENTRVDKFTTASKQEVDVDMMFQNAKFPFSYSDQLKCRAVQLGYQSSNIVMIILLPDEDSSLNELQSKLDLQSLDDLFNNFYSQKVQLTLPKFKLESSLQLIPVLAKLGIKQIFDAKSANFSGITDDPLGLYVGDVIQKAIIEVNEEGTEAAAATGIAFLSRSLVIPEEFKANRPFMFLLMTKDEDKPNLILFSGTVNNPKL